MNRLIVIFIVVLFLKLQISCKNNKRNPEITAPTIDTSIESNKFIQPIVKPEKKSIKVNVQTYTFASRTINSPKSGWRLKQIPFSHP